jgi:hypothetical protein
MLGYLAEVADRDGRPLTPGISKPFARRLTPPAKNTIKNSAVKF